MRLIIFGAITWQNVLVGFLLFAVTFAVSLAIVSFIMVKIPADYFKEDRPRELFPDKSRVIRWLAVVGKNLLGIVLVALGIVLSIPGVPGQGILTILLGITGALLGGIFRSWLGLSGEPAGSLLAIVGSLMLLPLFGAIAARGG